jgi:hypothetical protein
MNADKLTVSSGQMRGCIGGGYNFYGPWSIAHPALGGAPALYITLLQPTRGSSAAPFWRHMLSTF